MLNFRRNYQIILQIGLPATQQVQFLIYLSLFGVVSLFYYRHTSGYAVVSHCGIYIIMMCVFSCVICPVRYIFFCEVSVQVL